MAIIAEYVVALQVRVCCTNLKKIHMTCYFYVLYKYNTYDAQFPTLPSL